jgi:hypothetical protein
MLKQDRMREEEKSLEFTIIRSFYYKGIHTIDKSLLH